MAYKVLIFCPDQHILHTANTPEKKGIGGGIIARIRLAQHLACLGHDVTVIGHVPRPHKSHGARFLPLGERHNLRRVDILIMISSGDEISLEAAKELSLSARLREVWVQGTIPVKGVQELGYDHLIPLSNFVHHVARQEWKIPSEKLFVIYNGLTQYTPGKGFIKPQDKKDPFSLIYFSHPSKGLDAAVSVLRLLRQNDTRFKLHVFGGDALWGGEDSQVSEPGVIFHGTKSQREVLKFLTQCNVSIHLQERLEPFGMVVTESMKQGCIPIASPVGAFNETIQDGVDGFLVPGHYQEREVHQKTASIVDTLVRSADYQEYIRHNAMQVPWTWERQAKVWSQHWRWELEGEGEKISPDHLSCSACGGEWLLTADGYHCLGCGLYSQDGR